MIWKELRENIRWAALAFFALLLAEAYALSQGRRQFWRPTAFTLCGGDFLFVSAFGCVAVGAVLGALQILPELRRDQWASLLHRPVPRHTIFLGKVVAGLVLYTLATGLPLLACTAYVATPGHVPAPFVPGLMLPAVSDLLLGGAFYFCALLLGLHGGPWHGTRAVIGLSAVAVLILHLAGQWPFLLPLLAMAVFAVAAWGAMLGSVALRPWVSRCALGLALLLGVQTGLLLLGAALRGLQKNAVSFGSNSSFHITSDGRVFIQKTKKDGSYEFTDPQGIAVTDERYAGDNDGSHTLWPSYLAMRGAIDPWGGSRRARTSNGLAELVSNGDPPEFWYLLKGPRSYFVGYDRASARCIGLCDAEGFKAPGAPVRPFAAQPQVERVQTMPYLFWAGSKVFTTDFADRELVTLTDVGNDTIYGVVRFPDRLDRHRIAIALRAKIRILDPHGALLTDVPYAYDEGHAPLLSIAATGDFSRTFIEYLPGYLAIFNGGSRTSHLDAFDGQVQRMTSYSMEDASVSVTPPTWVDDIGLGMATPVPSLLRTLHDRTPSWESVLEAYEQGILAPITGINLPSNRLAVVFGFAVVLGVAAGVWGWRTGLSKGHVVTWVFVTIAFGLPGFLAYRLATAWPAQVRCPHCGRPRPIGTETCPRCRQAWQAVPPTGSEIFEAA